MSEQTPFWKKEISLSRKPKAEVEKVDADGTDPGEVVRTPWWKKEIGGSKKPKAVAPVDAEPKKTPWYKKEIGGSSKEPKIVAPAAAEPKKTPWYKKEIGGAKEPKAPKAPKAPKVEAASSVPWWKREVTIGPKRATKQEKTQLLPHRDDPL